MGIGQDSEIDCIQSMLCRNGEAFLKQAAVVGSHGNWDEISEIDCIQLECCVEMRRHFSNNAGVIDGNIWILAKILKSIATTK